MTFAFPGLCRLMRLLSSFGPPNFSSDSTYQFPGYEKDNEPFEYMLGEPTSAIFSQAEKKERSAMRKVRMVLFMNGMALNRCTRKKRSDWRASSMRSSRHYSRWYFGACQLINTFGLLISYPIKLIHLSSARFSVLAI